MAEGSVLIRSGRGKRAFAGEVSMPAGLGGNLADNQFFLSDRSGASLSRCQRKIKKLFKIFSKVL